MFEELVKEYKVKDYLLLFSILALGLGSFLYFGYSRPIQKLIVFLTSTGYVVWGIIHHALNRDLHLKVVMEYFLVALLASLTLLFLLERA
jgi:energy-converting hydrogenase Eha subunit H